jgi:diguanylate cyclase (GGDEF)-like protein
MSETGSHSEGGEAPTPGPLPGAESEPTPGPGSGELGSSGAPGAAVADGPGPGGAAEPPGSATGRLWAWALAALIVAAAGITASFLGARSVARNDASQARADLAAAGTSATATLKLATTHEEEIATAAGTFLAEHPQSTPGQLSAWAGWARLLHRHPELQRMTLIELVPASSLPAFAQQLGVPVTVPVRVASTSTLPASSVTPSGGGTLATPTSALSPLTSTATIAAAASDLHVRPSGVRPFYCLAIGEVVRHPSRSLPRGNDYCFHSGRLLRVGGSGLSLYANASSPRAQALLGLVPVYQGAATPGTSQGRRAALVGWVREVIEPQTLVSLALRGHEGDGVVLSHAAGRATATFSGGTIAGSRQVRAVNLRNGWTARIYGPVPDAGVLAHSDSRALLIVGSVLGLLAGILLLALGARATGMPRPTVRRRPPPAPASEGELYDALTGLPSRALTMDRAERMLARVTRQPGMLAGALLVDADRFADVNERLGRDAGDEVLRTIATRLQKVIRGEDTVGRLDGDRFLILVEAVARGARLDSLARRVIESLHEPVALEGFGPRFNVTASIGVAFGRYTDTQQMLSDAEAAVRSAKGGGGDRYTLFNANVRSVIEDRGVLEAELGRALEENQFSLAYQPVCDLRTNEVVSLEALLRWHHPLRGTLPPSEFISVAEDAGLTVPIGRWALEEACTQAASWSVAGRPLGVSVMVSRAQLNRDGLLTDVRRALLQSGLEPSQLTLEIAETTVMNDTTATSSRLAELRRLGVRIAIDDFGSGYAYRADLQRMSVDYLKVDRASLAAHEDEDYRSWLLEAILVFARDLSLTVIAKGVETAEQMTTLKAMGCTLAQGYFLGRPVETDTVEELLRERGVAPAEREHGTDTAERDPGVDTAERDPAWGGTPAT